MPKLAPDTTKEKAFFLERGKIHNPRRVRRVNVTTQIETKPKRSGKRGNAFQHTVTGARSDLDGLIVRSNWEANFIRVLRLFKIDFEFEPITFTFPPLPSTGKVNSYVPDIYLKNSDEFIEIKGYLDARGRNKLRKFKKHFPQEFSKLTVVISKTNRANLNFFTKLGVQKILFYENVSLLYGDKVNWEGKR